MHWGFRRQNLKLDGSISQFESVPDGQERHIAGGAARLLRPGTRADEAELAHEEIREALFSREEIRTFLCGYRPSFSKPTTRKSSSRYWPKVDLKTLRFRKTDGRNYNDLVIVAGVFDRNGNLVTAVQKTIEMPAQKGSHVRCPRGGGHPD